MGGLYMKAVVYQGNGVVKVQEVEKPTIIKADDAIVRVTTAAICGSDLHIIHGVLPVDPGTVIGHEFVGIVEEVGSAVTTVKPGDRVLSMAGINCGKCPTCRSRKVWACPNGGIFGNGPMFGNLQGVQAEFARVQYADEVLTKIPDQLEDEQVIFVGDILATGYLGITGVKPDDRGLIKPGGSVAIYGSGPVGLCTLAAAQIYGAAKIIMVDPLEYRLEMAGKMGADVLINPDKVDPVKAILEATNGLGAELAVEASGSDEALYNCIHSVCAAGTVNILGIVNKPIQLDFSKLIAKNITIEAGICNVIHTQELLDLISAARIDMMPIITHTMPLADAEKAYDIFDKRTDGVVKIILKP